MAKQKKWVKIMAFLALFWITIWIIWTWVLVLFSWNNTNSSNTQTLSAEDYAKLQEMIESQSWITTESQVEIINNTLTWTIK
jgi:hypothetical protein